MIYYIFLQCGNLPVSITTISAKGGSKISRFVGILAKKIARPSSSAVAFIFPDVNVHLSEI